MGHGTGVNDVIMFSQKSFCALGLGLDFGLELGLGLRLRLELAYV